MCVRKVDAWEHGGRLFLTEFEAIEAALKDLADRLMADHSTNMTQGLIAHSVQLIRLLSRRDEILVEPEISGEARAPITAVISDLEGNLT